MNKIVFIKEKSKTSRRSTASKYGYEQSAPAASACASPLPASPAGARGSPVAAAGMFASQQLSQHRQLVERLDSQPCLAYLRQNGALTENDVDEIRSLTEQSRAQGNIRLLRCLEEKGRYAQNLLVNVLRQTGQHGLANLMDEGIRIKKFTGSGYLSKKRRRGQVSIEVEVRAIKVPQESVSSLIKKPAPKPDDATTEEPIRSADTSVPEVREWVSMEDVRTRINKLSASIAQAQAQQVKASETQLSSIQQFQLVETQDEEIKSSQCCLCACLSSLFSSKKKKKNAHKSTSAKLIPMAPVSRNNSHRSDQYKYGDANGNGVHLNPSINGSANGTNSGNTRNSSTRSGASSSNHYISSASHATTTMHVTNESRDVMMSQSLDALTSQSCDSVAMSRKASMDNLQSLLDMLKQKADILYNTLQESTCETRIKLLKYLEQTRGVLVLETSVDDSLVIVNICTKAQQFVDLKRDFMSGKLNTDLEECIVTEEVLEKMGVQGMKINTIVSEEDLDLAEHEFHVK